MPKLAELIKRHKSFYNATEKRNWDKARRYYNGHFTVRSLVQDTTLFETSLNMVFAIAETGIAALLGSNPRIAATPRTKKSIDQAPLVADLVNYIWDENNIRHEAALTLTDATLVGRGVFKTTWDATGDVPTTIATDPSTVFFDLAARRPCDIRYWLQVTVLSEPEFKRRVKDKLYTVPSDADVKPTAYPTWLLPSAMDNKEPSQKELRGLEKWYEIWEYYDEDNNRVQHYLPNGDVVLMDEELEYVPFSLWNMNQNGVDCRGLSEVQLILPQQEDINDCLSQMKLITLLSIPKILFDAGAIDGEQIADLVQAATGSFVGVNPTKNVGGRTLGDLFFEAPMSDIPQNLAAFEEKLEKIVAVVSALAESARGQVTGARTATEMALIDAQSRTRLGAREGHLAAALEDAAEKSIFLASRYMKKPKLVEVTAGDWQEIGLKDIRDIEVKFQLSLYNPTKNNPMVMAEMFNASYPVLAQDEVIDQRLLRQEYLRINGLRPDMLMEEQEQDMEEEVSPEAMAELAALAGADAGGLTEQLPGGEVAESPNTIQSEALDAAMLGAAGNPQVM